MGTSKGYIPPTRPEWSNAKRAVSTLLREGDADSRAKAAAKFADAMISDGISEDSSFANAAGRVLGIARSVADGNVNESLIQFGRDDLIGKEPEEILEELLNQFTSDKSTMEDSLSADAISQAFEELGIKSLEDLGLVDLDVLLQTMISAYICISFDLHFEEKIGKGKSPKEKDSILEAMHNFIKDTIHANIDEDGLKTVDLSKLSNNELVSDTLKEALKACKEYYGE